MFERGPANFAVLVVAFTATRTGKVFLPLVISLLGRAVSLRLVPRSLVVRSDFDCFELRARGERETGIGRSLQLVATLTTIAWCHCSVGSASDRRALANVEDRWRFDVGRMPLLTTRDRSDDDSVKCPWLASRPNGVPQTTGRARAASALPPSQGALAEVFPARKHEDLHRWKLTSHDF
jgi:hypothetical protein